MSRSRSGVAAATARRRSCRGCLGRGRVDPARRRRATRRRCGSRSCTTRPAERLLARRGRRDRARDRALPRAGERLERHRLQLSRRPLRHGLRGPLRRHRPERRSARTRWASTPAPSASRSSGRTATPPSPAAQDAIAAAASPGGSISRTSIRRRFLTYISGGSERYASGIPVLLSAVSGHRDTGLHRVPGQRALRAPRRDRGDGRGARRAEDLRAARPRSSGTSIRVRAQALARAAVDGRRSRARPAPRWHAARDGHGRRLDVGVGRRARRLVHVDDRAPGAHARRPGLSAPAAAQRRSRSRRSPPSPRRSARTATARRTPRRSRTGSRRPRTSRSRSPTRSEASSRRVVDRVWTRAGPAHGDRSTERRSRTVTTTSSSRLARRRASPCRSVIPLSVNRTLGLVTVAPAAFSPNGDGRKDTSEHAVHARGACATVRIRIEREGRWVASPLAGSLRAWNARLHVGRRSARPVSVARRCVPSRWSRRRAESGSSRTASRSSLDTVAPRVRILPGKRAAGRGERAVDAHVRDRRRSRCVDEVRRAGRRPDPVERSADAGSRRSRGTPPGNAERPVVRIQRGD